MEKQFELSIWQDMPSSDGGFSEEKVAIIGGTNYKGPEHAFNITEQRMVNGDRTLSFSIAGKYLEKESGELVDNPFRSLLINERKIKLRDGEPYSFNTSNLTDLGNKDVDRRWKTYVIKNISESSENYIFTYTAKEIYVNELGKNGFSITLNAELNNNYGTLLELSERVLEGSDWKSVIDDKAMIERKQSPLFVAQLSASITATKAMTGEEIVIAQGEKIYPFYDSLKRGESGNWEINNSVEFQFLYNEQDSYPLDEDRVVIDDNNDFNFFHDAPELIGLKLTGDIGTEPMQGNYLVESQPLHFDSDAQKYVHPYKVKSTEVGLPIDSIVFGYPETIYNVSDIIENHLTNYKNFVNNASWNSMIMEKVRPISLPIPSSNNIETWSNIDITNYLSIDFSSANTAIYNEGPRHARLTLVKGKYYVLRVKGRFIKKGVSDYGTNGSNISVGDQPSVTVSLVKDDGINGFTPVTTSRQITSKGTYLDQSIDTSKRGYVSQSSTRATPAGGLGPHADEEQYAYVYLQASQSTNSVLDKLHLKIINTGTSLTHNYCIEDIQLFEYVEDSKGRPIFPGDTPTADVLTQTIYYHKDENNNIFYLPTDDSYYETTKREKFEAARSFDTQESNYFNNTASLAEMFEVWVSYSVTHDKTGRIWKDPVTKEAEKIVYFSQYAPTDLPYNQAGFKYGINLNTIQRTIDSNQLTTKVIVKPNNQEHAIDGSASITRSKENPSGENEIYNFNYYINQGLLELNEVLADLYGFTSKDLAMNSRLRSINDVYSIKSNQLLADERKLKEIESNQEYYELGISSANEQIDYQNFFLSNLSDNDKKVKQFKVAVAALVAQRDSFLSSLEEQERLASFYSNRIAEEEAEIENLLQEKKIIKQQFYKKYSRFLQEGQWTDDTYVNDDLYYIDASKIASSSAFPQTSYSINVVDLFGIENYEGFEFKIGSKTYIEDTQFFGYVYNTVPEVGRVKTPYKMEAIVVQQNYSYDNPTQNQIIIQTYKNQYKDIFQQLVATTNDLQYTTSNFGLVASQFTETGEIKPQAIEQVFNNNALTLAGSGLQEINFSDGKGIEVISKENNALQLRLIGEGIYLTSDGGRNWTSAVSPLGINTRLLQTGQLDTSRINILNGGITSFRWDEDGISAYKHTDDQYSVNDYVRLNEFGLFGTNTGLDLEVAINNAETFDDKLAAVKKHSNWALTWDGLNLKAQQGSVSLTPLGGFEVYNPNILFPEKTIEDYEGIVKPDGEGLYTTEDLVPLVSLGRYYTKNGDLRYGLAMRNYDGIFTLLTDNEGDLTLSNTLTVGTENGLRSNAPDSDKYYRYLVIDGAPQLLGTNEYGNPVYEDVSERPILFAGGLDGETAPLRIYGDGRISGEKFDVRGYIEATGGAFTGDVLVGGTSGISGADSVDGTPYAFWAGENESGPPLWRVTHEGIFYAEEAYINGKGTFEGDIYADNGYFNGIINAAGGAIQNHLTFGPGANTWIGSRDDYKEILNVENMFSVDELGNVFGDSLFLVKDSHWNNLEKEKNYNIIIGKGAGSSYILEAFAPGTETEQEKRVFGISQDGSTEIAGRLRLSGELHALDDLILYGNITNPEGSFIINGTKGSIANRTPAYDGWGIYSDGTAFFNNVDVRGALKTTVFKKDHTSGMAGRLLISPSVVIEEEVDSYDGLGNFKLPGQYFSEAWGDIESVFINYPDETTENAIVTKEDGNYYIQLERNKLEKGTHIISKNMNHNSIELNGEHKKGGFIRITGPVEDISEVVDPNHNYERMGITLLGNLSDELIPYQARRNFGDDLGYGLFSDNAYLMGRMYLPSAGITDESDKHKYPFDADISSYNHEDAEIRFWAGTSPEDRELAPFIVTQDGSFYAKRGEFEGRIVAHDSIFHGVLDGAGAVLDEPFFFIDKSLYEEGGDQTLVDSSVIVDVTGVQINKNLEINSTTESPTSLYLKNKELTNWKILSVINEDIQPRVSLTGAHIWGWNSVEQEEELFSTYINPKGISFTSTPTLINNYFNVEQSLVSNPSKIFLGKSEQKWGLFGDKISFGSVSQPSISYKRENEKNITDLYGDFIIGETIRVSHTGTEVHFTYVGD